MSQEGVLAPTGATAGDWLAAPRRALARWLDTNHPPRTVSREQGLELADRLYRVLNHPEFAQRLLRSYGEDLFIGRAEQARPDPAADPEDAGCSWWRPELIETPMICAVGLRPMPQAKGSNSLDYRLAVRLQSPRQIKPNRLKAIRNAFRQSFAELVSVRWSSPARLRVSNPEGDYRPWRGPNSGRFECGAPTNIAGGAVGALTILLKHEGRLVGLTSGHVISDGGHARPGMPVFSPPQPEHGAGEQRLGSVRTLSVLQTLRLSGGRWSEPPPRSAANTVHDYALIDVEPACGPLESRRRRIGELLYAADFFRGDFTTGLRLHKAPAKTKDVRGTLRATDFRLEAYDPMTARMVFAEGLLEIELDKRATSARGDSGALMCAEVDGQLHPAAKLLAGVRSAKLQNHDSRSVGAVYALPLTAIDAIKPMAVA